MVNKDFGWIKNKDGIVKNIDVNMDKGTVVDVLIGCAIIGIGVAYLVHNSFYRGANEFMNSEYQVLEDLGLFKN